MSDSRDDNLRERLAERARREELRREERVPETAREAGLAELVDGAVRKVVTAIVIAGGLIGLGAYWGGDEFEAPRYQVTSTADGRILRVNTDSGTVIACRDDRCGIVLRRGQDIAEEIGEEVRERIREEARERALPAPTPAAPKADNAAAPAPATR